MEGERLTTSDRTLVPNRFVVHLHPADLAEFGEMTGSLASELADGALSFARAHRYTVVDRPRVDLAGRSDDRAGRHPRRRPVRRAGRRARPVTGRSRWRPRATGRRTSPIRPRPASSPSRARRTPRAVLRVTDPDGRVRDVVVEPGGLTIGRATDNDLVALDGRVSRHHGRIVGRRGTLVYADLGSTNGSRVNGVPVTRGRPGCRRPARGGGYRDRRRGRRGARLMDGFLLVLWAVRLLFLALIYLFLSRVVRALLRDLRAAAREPADRPGRLIVLDSPSGEPPAGHSFGLDVITRARPRRQQRDRHRRSVRVGRSRGPDLPRPELVRGGPGQHERLVRQRPAGRGRRPDGLRRRAPDRPGPDAARAGPAVSATAAPTARPSGAPRAILGRSARARAGSSSVCSASSRSTLLLGSVSLNATVNGEFRLYDAPGPARLHRGAASSPTPHRSWPAAARTRSCCRPSRCSAGSRCC